MTEKGSRTWAALGLGLLPVVSLAVDIGVWPIFLLGLLASAAAGWLMPDDPVRAGVLAYAPTTILLTVAGLRFLAPGVLLPLLMGLMVSLVGSHLGAGAALRRREAT